MRDAPRKGPRIRALPPLLALALAGCASAADTIEPASVSPLGYRDLDCAAIEAEAWRVADRARVIAGLQDRRATRDTLVTTLGILAFPPALLMTSGDGLEAAELARLRGEFASLRAVSEAHGCASAVLESVGRRG